MHRKAKLDLDYRILHTSGEKVIKIMTEKLVQEDLDSVSDLDEFMEDHNPQDLETKDEAENIIAKFEKIMERFKRCQSELKVALQTESSRAFYDLRGGTFLYKSLPDLLSLAGVPKIYITCRIKQEYELGFGSNGVMVFWW